LKTFIKEVLKVCANLDEFEINHDKWIIKSFKDFKCYNFFIGVDVLNLLLGGVELNELECTSLSLSDFKGDFSDG
jgi:hypothetical protein